MIKYKASHSNRATDFLSRLYEDSAFGNNQQLVMATSSVQFDFLKVLHHENKTLPDLLELHTRLQDQVATIPSVSSLNGLLMYRGRLFLGKDSSLKKLLLQEFHETPIVGHVGVQRTYLCLAANIFGRV